MDMVLFALAAVTQSSPVSPPTPTLAQASASMENRSECVAFKWLSDDKGTVRAAISVPVVINGKTLPLQLDTGADATILYGRVADRAGWGKPGQKSFRSASLAIGSTMVDRPLVLVATDMQDDPELAGTLGLPALIGRVAVIDYPHQRFCLFAEADLPAALTYATYTRADLRFAKLFVPIDVGAFHSDAIVFDTGSSVFPLSVDMPTWTRLTGRKSVEGAPASYQGSAWGKPVTFSGAAAASPMMLGKLDLGRPTVFTNAAQPNELAGWPYRADGILGNATLWDGIVILDMTANVRIGYVR